MNGGESRSAYHHGSWRQVRSQGMDCEVVPQESDIRLFFFVTIIDLRRSHCREEKLKTV
jgi:hypothetical protein